MVGRVLSVLLKIAEKGSVGSLGWQCFALKVALAQKLRKLHKKYLAVNL